MKTFFKTITAFSICALLAGCSGGATTSPNTQTPPVQQDVQQPSAAEQSMADMMGITVEELRNQTPEEHMKAMQDMMKDDHHNGEDVADHAHSDDHHAGEENVEPHSH